MAKIGEPIIIGAGTTGTGVGFNVPANLLQNQCRAPIAIEEIAIYAARDVTSDTPYYPAQWLRLKVSSGRFAITDGFVPMPGFGAQERSDLCSWTGRLGGTSTKYISHARLKFRPFPMDVGQALEVSFDTIFADGTRPQAGGQTRGTQASVYVAARGKIIGAMPNRFSVPYLSSYLGVAGANTSGATDLMNSRGKPLDITHLFYSLFAAGGVSGGGGKPSPVLLRNPIADLTALAVRNTQSSFDAAGTGGAPLYGRITLGAAQHEVVPKSNLATVFNVQGVLPFKGTLQPREKLNVLWEADSTPGGVSLYVYPLITMLGYTEEAL